MRSPFVLSLGTSVLCVAALDGRLWGLTAWFCLVPLFFLLDIVRRPGRVFLWAWFSGTVTYLCCAWWLCQVTIPGYLLTALALGAYFGVFGLVNPHFSPLIAASLWTFLEFARSRGPLAFPWFILGVSQHEHMELLQAVSLGGPLVLSFIIVFVNHAIYALLAGGRSGILRRGATAAAGIGMAAGLWLFGAARLQGAQESYAGSASIKMALIQGNVAQPEKWDPLEARSIFEKYEKITLEAARHKPDLIVWPETALPVNIRKLTRPMERIARTAGAWMLVGGDDDRLGTEGVITNTAFLLNPEGGIVSQYDKIHLVPYGEYVPLRKWMPWIGKVTLGEIDFSPGRIFKVFDKPEPAFSAMICFEDTLCGHMRKFVRAGASLIINLTNDAWFGTSNAAREHLNLSRFCAIANGVGLARATNTGVSAFVSPYGEILSKVQDASGKDLEVGGFVVRDMPLVRLETLYAAYGDVFPWACGIVVILMFVGRWRPRSGHPERSP